MLYKQDIRECFLDHKDNNIGLHTILHPTYDVDQTYRQGSINIEYCPVPTGQYHENNIIILWYS